MWTWSFSIHFVFQLYPENNQDVGSRAIGLRFITAVSPSQGRWFRRPRT